MEKHEETNVETMQIAEKNLFSCNYKNRAELFIEEYFGNHNISNWQKYKIALKLQSSDCNAEYIDGSTCNFSEYTTLLVNGIFHADAHNKKIEYKENIKESVIDSICNNIQQKYKILPKNYYVESVKITSFKNNPFGKHKFDSTVCFRDGSDRENIFPMLKKYTENNANISHYLRIKNEEDKTVGRAIMTVSNEGCPIIWNCYSDNNRVNAIAVSNWIASQSKNKVSKKVNFQNDEGTSHNLFYVNGSIGYAICDISEYENVGSQYVSMDESEYGEKCDNCGGECGEYGRTTNNGDNLCEECWNERFMYCDGCDSDIDTETETYYTITVSRRETITRCSNCVNAH